MKFIHKINLVWKYFTEGFKYIDANYILSVFCK